MTNELSSPPRRASARRNLALSAAVAAVLALPSAGGAFEFDTGNEDLSIRWDNTVQRIGHGGPRYECLPRRQSIDGNDGPLLADYPRSRITLHRRVTSQLRVCAR